MLLTLSVWLLYSADLPRAARSDSQRTGAPGGSPAGDLGPLSRDLEVPRNVVLIAYEQLIAEGYATGKSRGWDVLLRRPWRGRSGRRRWNRGTARRGSRDTGCGILRPPGRIRRYPRGPGAGALLLHKPPWPTPRDFPATAWAAACGSPSARDAVGLCVGQRGCAAATRDRPPPGAHQRGIVANPTVSCR